MQTYRIIELRNYDVLLPFICQKCGACCLGFAPQIPANDLPAISEHLGKNVEEIKRLHEIAYNKKSTDSPADCSFLNDKNQCSIYPVRPEPCRLYPLETDCGEDDVNCGGHKELYKIVDAFFTRRKYAAVWRPNAYQRAIRRIPDHQWPVVWKTFSRVQPSNAMIRQFVKLNQMSDHLRRKTDWKHIGYPLSFNK